MPQIAFFIELNNNRTTIEGVDLDIGNPGIGGTQYLFLLTVKALNCIYGEDYSTLLTDTCFDSIDSGIKTDYAKTAIEAIRYCESHNIRNLVLNANVADRISPKAFETTIDIMLWAHNTLNATRQKLVAQTRSIKWLVCVSESQYNNMADTPCFNKCTFVNNIIPAYFYEHASLTDYSEEKVAYIGSLMPQKGAHSLVDIWKYVEKQLPCAQLYVFGGANVWNGSSAISAGGVADPYYDHVLQKRLDKLIHPENIHFMGAKGWSFIDSFISSFRLGIVNPSHYMRDETFCLSAIEMGVHGLPIVSRQRRDGLGSTVIHNETGYLEEDDKDIADRIISLVSNPDKCRLMGMKGREYASLFIAQEVVKKWRILSEQDNNVQPIRRIACLSNDAIMLKKDYLLKIGYLIESGKAIDLVKRKLKGGN